MSKRILPAIFADSPWIDFRDADSDVLLITFSSVATEKGKFTPYTQINDIPYAILRVNTIDKLWYVGGIPETDLQPNFFEQELDAFIANGEFKKVIFYGGSKGGWGAIDIGLRTKSDIIIATGAETVFGHPDGYAKRVVPPLRIEVAKRRIKEWPKLIEKRYRQIYAIYGWDCLVDREFAAEIPVLLGVRPIMLRNCDHAVPVFITKNGKLADVIIDLVETGKSSFIDLHMVQHTDAEV